MADARNQNNPTQTQNQNPPQASPGQGAMTSATQRDPKRTMEPSRSREIMRQGGEWSPFSFMQRFMRDMDRLFDEFPFGRSSAVSNAMSPRDVERGNWMPQVDIFERGDKVVVHADLAGLRQEDVRVTTDDGTLTISGERRHDHEHEAGGVYRCERSYGSFQRSLLLPEGVEPESIQASFDNGVLEVTMPIPKARSPRGRTIPIGNKPTGTGGVKH